MDDDPDKRDKESSVSQAAVAELKARQRRAEVERFRAELREMNSPWARGGDGQASEHLTDHGEDCGCFRST
jgi:hypothetical protein